MTQIGQLFVKIGADVSGLQTGFSSAEKSTEKLDSRFQRITKTAGAMSLKIAAAGATIAAGLEVMGRRAAAQNEQLDKLAITTGIASNELRDLAVATSNVTFPMNEVIGLFQQAREQGLETGEELQRFAQFWDMVGDATGESSEALARSATALRAMGISAAEQEKALGAYGYIVKNTSIGVNEFNRLIERAAPQLNEMGMSLDRTTAMLGVMESRGIRGRQAVAEFNRAVNAAEGDQTALFAALGITTDELAKQEEKIKDSAGVIKDLSDAHAESYTWLQKIQHSLSETATRYGGLLQSASRLTPALMGISAAVPIIDAVAGSKLAASAAAKIWTAANIKLTASMAAGAAPIALIAAAVVALTATIYYGVKAYQAWKKASEDAIWQADAVGNAERRLAKERDKLSQEEKARREWLLNGKRALAQKEMQIEDLKLAHQKAVDEGRKNDAEKLGKAIAGIEAHYKNEVLRINHEHENRKMEIAKDGANNLLKVYDQLGDGMVGATARASAASINNLLAVMNSMMAVENVWEGFGPKMSAAQGEVARLNAALASLQTTVGASGRVGGGGGRGKGDDDDSVADTAERELERLRELYASERELEEEKHIKRREDIERLVEDETEKNELLELEAERHAEAMKAMKDREEAENKARLAREVAAIKQRVETERRERDTMLGNMRQNLDKVFKDNKAYASAAALVDAYQAISSSYRFGASIGGPPMGAAMASIAAAAQFKVLSDIRSVSRGSSGGGGYSGGAVASAPAPSAAPSAAPGGGGVATINLVGGDSASFTGGQVRDLIEQINEQVAAGMTIRVA